MLVTVRENNEGLTLETAELKKKFTSLKNSLCSFSFPIFYDWAWTPFVSHQDRSLPKKHSIKENHANEWSLQASENANSYGIINHVEVAVWLKLFSDVWHNLPWHRLWEVPNFSRDKSACKIIPPLKSSQSRRRQLFSTPLKLCVLHVAHTGVFKTWNSKFFSLPA